jgi:uncharacterized protein YndB with AHSA1/START domain
MTKLDAATRSLVVERVIPHPPEKIWRALTEGPLIEEWLMANDSGFRPEDEVNYQGASYGWQRFVAALERVAAGLD